MDENAISRSQTLISGTFCVCFITPSGVEHSPAQMPRSPQPLAPKGMLNCPHKAFVTTAEDDNRGSSSLAGRIADRVEVPIGRRE
jgi:hypothetical protein